MSSTEFTAEEWRPVVGFEGIYEVSDHGRVRSLDRLSPHRRHGQVRLKGVIRKPYYARSRAQLQLGKEGRSYLGAVHRLVLEAFVGPCPPGMEGCHNDGNPHNNRLENLRWDTGSANTFDAVKHGTHPAARRTHCKHGHEFNAENTSYTKDGRRICKPCRRESSARRRGPAKPPPPHCPHGHEYTPENTHYNPSTRGRQCRECNRIRCRRQHAARKAAAA